MAQEIVKIGHSDLTSRMFGACDAHVRAVENAFHVDVRNRSDATGDTVIISGSDTAQVALAAAVMDRLKEEAARAEEIPEQRVSYLIGMVRDGRAAELTALDDSAICITSRGKPVRAKTVGQRKYVNAIAKNTIVLGVGPAGTGKTFLAVAMAVKALREKQVTRIILTRPAIEAGEKLGISNRLISKCCSGELIQTHGYHFCYAGGDYINFVPRENFQGQKGKNKKCKSKSEKL